jgi:hypothetical protein
VSGVVDHAADLLPGESFGPWTNQTWSSCSARRKHRMAACESAAAIGAQPPALRAPPSRGREPAPLPRWRLQTLRYYERHGLLAEPGGEALENQWNSAAMRHYRATEPSRLAKDTPLYTL